MIKLKLFLVLSLSFYSLATPIFLDDVLGDEEIYHLFSGAGQAGDGINAGNGQSGDGANFIETYGKINETNPFQNVLERIKRNLKSNYMLKKLIADKFVEEDFTADDIYHSLDIKQLVQSLEIDNSLPKTVAYKVQGNKIFVNPVTFAYIYKWETCDGVFQDLAILRLVIEYYGFPIDAGNFHSMASEFGNYTCNHGPLSDL